MTRGQTLNVAINPLGGKQLLPAETFAPAHLELRNGLRTDGGFYRGRPGYVSRFDVGVDEPITLLIPRPRLSTDLGFAVTESGQIYELHKDYTSQLMTGPTLNGVFRPTWCEFDDTVIVCDGQAPIAVDQVGTTTALLGGSPPAAKFCAVIADRVILAGYDDTGFQWSDPGSSTTWSPGNIGSVTGNGERIRFMQDAGTDLYFFKDCSIEIWAHIGGVEVFGRRGIIPFADKRQTHRPMAGFSAVLAKQWYWYANGDFWTLNGFTPQAISGTYKRAIEALKTTEDCYGFDFQKEHVIRWFFPTEGRCFVYDYINGVFTEDTGWAHGQHTRLPIFGYMEVDGTAYIGDYNATGQVFEWSSDVQTDNGADIRLLRAFRVALHQSGHKCSVNRLRLRIERGHGQSSTSPQAMIRWNFDEGDWTPYRSVSLGEVGDRDPYIDVLNHAGTKVLGKGREMTIELVQTAQVRHLMTHALLTVQPLGS